MTSMTASDHGRPLGPIAPQSLQAVVFEQLRRAILDGSLQPGERLVERELAERFQVSKTPVREAMQELARRGLLTRRTYRGMEVRRVGADLVREIYQVRAALEPEALRFAVRLYTEETKAALRQTLVDSALAGTRHDLAELAFSNRRFHTLLHEPCPNRLLCAMIDDLSDQVALITVAGWRQEATWHNEALEHEAILGAIEAGDADEAARRLERHIRRALANLVEALRDSLPDHDGVAQEAEIPSDASQRR